MKKKKEQVLDQFLNQETDDVLQTSKEKKKVLDEREGLIERIDRVLVTKDGKQLLREQY